MIVTLKFCEGESNGSFFTFQTYHATILDEQHDGDGNTDQSANGEGELATTLSELDLLHSEDHGTGQTSNRASERSSNGPSSGRTAAIDNDGDPYDDSTWYTSSGIAYSSAYSALFSPSRVGLQEIRANVEASKSLSPPLLSSEPIVKGLSRFTSDNPERSTNLPTTQFCSRHFYFLEAKPNDDLAGKSTWKEKSGTAKRAKRYEQAKNLHMFRVWQSLQCTLQSYPAHACTYRSSAIRM